MQDEEIDNMDELIREASKSHYSVYDDKAWEKMEVLLDKHLPLKKGRTRPAILFILMLFIAGSALFAILYPWHKKGSISVESKLADNPLQRIPSYNQPDDADHLMTKVPKISRDKSTEFLAEGGEEYNPGNLRKTSSNNHFTVKKGHIKNTGSGALNAINDITDKKDISIKADKAFPERDEQAANNNKTSTPVFSADRSKDQPVKASTQAVKNNIAGIDVKKVTNKAAEPVTRNSPVKGKIKKGFANNLAIDLSAGPDLSFVGFGGPGKVRLNYGAGLSYTFANRVTLRSGFYVVNKTYSAKPSDYHPPDGYWTYFADVQRIDADCNIYEIPLAASYNFKHTKNHNWFAGFGFSTFLMKSETYNYLYKDQWGQTLYKGWTLKNENKHYFSVLTISGGYQYRINNQFSILAEPYLKLPLSGIGFGKIKLNSGGLFITASIQPFANRK